MYAGSFVLHTLFLVLISDNPHTYGSETGNCTIAVKRGTQYKEKSGNLATIQCPVMYCQERPDLRWYKGGDTDDFIVQNGQRHNASWMNTQLFVLTISSAHQNDSGQYHCAGTLGSQALTGHSIEVTIQGTVKASGLAQLTAQAYSCLPKSTSHYSHWGLLPGEEPFEFKNATNATEDGGAAEKNKHWVIYSLSVLGALCLLAISCFGLLHFAQKHSAKNKKTDDILQNEMNVFSIYTDVQHCNDSTIHDSDERSMCHQGAKSCLLQFQDGSADYDNDVSCWKTTGTIPNPAGHYSVITVHQPLPATQETLYATLNHDEYFQRSEPSVQTQCIEYAAIGMKK